MGLYVGDERHNVLDIHPPGFSHGSGLDGDARQHQDASREGCEEGGEKEGQHYRDGAVRVDQRAREVGRKKRAEMVTRCASHCNRPFFFYRPKVERLAFPSLCRRRATASQNKHSSSLLKRTEHKSCVPEIPPNHDDQNMLRNRTLVKYIKPKHAIVLS